MSSTVAIPAGVLVVPGEERGSQPSVIPTCGSAVTTVISAASTPRSSVILPNPHTTGASPVMSAATSSLKASAPDTAVNVQYALKK